MKVFLALAEAGNEPLTAKAVAAWINKRWGGDERVAEKHIGNVLGEMRSDDESRSTDKLVETEGGKNPYKYTLGQYTVKTHASAEMLIKFNQTFFDKGRILSLEDEQQIKNEISGKYSIPIPTLEERLHKAIKGKYLTRSKDDGLLTPRKRLSEELDLLKALHEFNPEVFEE